MLKIFKLSFSIQDLFLTGLLPAAKKIPVDFTGFKLYYNQ